MLENKDNNEESKYENEHPESNISSENGDVTPERTSQLKMRIAAIGKTIWSFVGGYLIIIKEWFSGKRGTRADRLAMAICLALAVAVWLYVMGNNDTGFEKQLTDVSVKIEGASDLGDENMSIISGYDQKVSITLKGKRNDISSLTSDDLRLYVDVSNITEAGRHTLDVMLDLPSNSSLVAMEPSKIPIEVDVNDVKTVEIQIKPDYIIDSSYTLEATVQDHDSVTISGPVSVLDTIAYAAVSKDLGTVEKSLTFSDGLKLYDEYGMVVSNPYIKCNLENVTVSVKVTTTKTVPLQVNFANGISQPYRTKLTPSNVNLVGDPGILAGMDEIYVYTVEEGSIKVGEPLFKYVSKLNLPNGVSAVDWEGVSIVIERLY